MRDVCARRFGVAVWSPTGEGEEYARTMSGEHMAPLEYHTPPYRGVESGGDESQGRAPLLGVIMKAMSHGCEILCNSSSSLVSGGLSHVPVPFENGGRSLGEGCFCFISCSPRRELAE